MSSEHLWQQGSECMSVKQTAVLTVHHDGGRMVFFTVSGQQLSSKAQRIDLS